MRIGIFPNLVKEESAPLVHELMELCLQYQVDFYLPEDVRNGKQSIFKEIPEAHLKPRGIIFNSIDVAMVLGGDGTILKLAREFAGSGVPICGVNIGSLGFLYEVETESLKNRLKDILEGRFFIEERMMLQADLCLEDGSVQIMPEALNDIVVGHGIHMVVGTTGLTASQRNELGKIADEHKTNIFIAPNFSIGAVLMMKISEIIAPYMPDAEIIELHHNNKLDAPSGTAILTAAKINDARKAAHVEAALDKTHESLEGARGAKVDDIPVHSVRLPGYVAHQQVLFGGYGELLTIRHDSLDRKSFMPGVILAVKKVGSYPGLTFGLENFL